MKNELKNFNFQVFGKLKMNSLNFHFHFFKKKSKNFHFHFYEKRRNEFWKMGCWSRFQFLAKMKNENELKFWFFIFEILRKINWHTGTLIHWWRVSESGDYRKSSAILIWRTIPVTPFAIYQQKSDVIEPAMNIITCFTCKE